MQTTAEQLTEAHFDRFRRITPDTTPEQVHWSELRIYDCEFEGHQLHVDAYYKNDEAVKRGEPVGGLRFHVTVWHPECSIQSETGETDDVDRLMEVIRETAARVDRVCIHENAREVSAAEARKNGVEHYGMCWHVYYCPDCKCFYGLDSSD